MTNKDLRIDVHIHLAGTGCSKSGCWVSPKFRRRYTFLAIKYLLKVTNEQMNTTIDQDWVARIASYIEESPLDMGVILGFDGVYKHDTGSLIEEKSQMKIPPSWVFKACRSYKGLLPGPSINPHKKTALEELEYAIENKAVLIKWLPSAQGIDPSVKDLMPFYRLLAENGLPLLVHIGGERTFAEVAPELNDILLLRPALDAGVTIICAHSGTPVLGSGERDQIPDIEKMIGEYDRLFLDNSGILNPGRFHAVKRLLGKEVLLQRMLYGSDWPVPTNSFYFPRALGFRKMRQLEKQKNPLFRDLLTKRSLGFGEESEFRAARVLPHIDYWHSLAR